MMTIDPSLIGEGPDRVKGHAAQGNVEMFQGRPAQTAFDQTDCRRDVTVKIGSM